MSGRRRKSLISVACLSLLAASILAPSALAVDSDAGGDVGMRRAAEPRIAFVLACDVWMATPTGEDGVNLTPNTPNTCDGNPSISHDGAYVAYQSSGTTTPGANVWLYNIATGAKTQLTTDGRSGAPDFSPVANVIAFQRMAANGIVANIYSMNVSGEVVKTWTNDTAVADVYRYNFTPEWSSDGKEIYYRSSRDDYFCLRERGGYNDVFLAYQLYKVDGAGLRVQLTDDPNLEVQGVAVAGAAVAYTARVLPDAEDFNLCDSEPVNEFGVYVNDVKRADSGPFAPTWSDDGDVVFSTIDGNIASVPAGGGAVTTLFPGQNPDWGSTEGTGTVRGPSTISLNYNNTQGIRANGQVVPAHGGTKVTITLAVQKGTRWKVIKTQRPELSPKSRYVVKFDRPNEWLCQLTARFPGDADHKPSSATKTFSC